MEIITVSNMQLEKWCKFIFLPILLLIMSGCDSSDDESESGWVKFYNASPDSPAIYLTLDEDLEEDFDDEFEETFSAVNLGDALSNREVPTGNYFFELGWNDEGSIVRADLDVLADGSLNVRAEYISLIVLAQSAESPEVEVFDIPIIDEEDDTTNDLFNLRLLNVTHQAAGVDVYISSADESFNEAVLLATANYMTLTDNLKLSEDTYKFYLTEPGATEVVFESTDVQYLYSSQYVLMIRSNDGAGSSPYVIDNVGNTSTTSYYDSDAEARLRIYNGLQTSSYLPEYSGALNVSIAPAATQEVFTFSELAVGGVSPSELFTNGDYSLSLYDTLNAEALASNVLLSLPENSNQTLFVYSTEEYLDDDNDGNYDEDEDGIIDGVEIKVKTLLVENSDRERVYDHEVKTVNLAYSEDFTRVTFYFVKSNESIANAEYRRTTITGNAESIVLPNNTYDVFAIASVDGTDIILDSGVLTLDENSNEMYLLLESDPTRNSGVAMHLTPQID
ncbi:hypothetical protein [Alteromonas flava]|uniref:hypothetical protein n=1 Tax=Alteromonas flava TaxID=2048003 RepID=UPI0013DD2E16|nr:hypothetical protein [Alteromonas flava]